MKYISFNKPYMTGNETAYIAEAVKSGKISGNGNFTKKCQKFFEETYGFKKCLLTTSCTDALEMAAILLDIKEGDEVIMPSFTFVSTANAFVLRGAKIIFCDSRPDHPGMDETKIEQLITSRTRAIVPVHYAGKGCDMNIIMSIANKNNLFVVEDAAQAIDNYLFDNDGNKRALGSFGHMSTFSFHETKNIISGEGGMLVINDQRFVGRAEIIWEKGTNRSAFFRGEVDKYGWVDIGSSFLPSEIVSAFLFAQLESIENIQKKRLSIWHSYFNGLMTWANLNSITIHEYKNNEFNNAHMFYLICDSIEQRTVIINALNANGINSVFHYLSLHKSPFFNERYEGDELIESDKYSNCLLRLPLYYELSEDDIQKIIQSLKQINFK